MLKDTITYKTPHGEERTRDVYFHIQMAQMAQDMDLEGLLERFQAMQKVVDEPERVMSQVERQEMFNLIRDLMKAGYGIREGDRHKQDEPPGTGEIWREFYECGAYEAYLFSVFRDEKRSTLFMENVWPEAIKEEMDADSEGIPDEEALLAMSDEEFDATVAKHSEGKNVPFPLVRAGMKRKTSS
jgi:hypothetical protein